MSARVWHDADTGELVAEEVVFLRLGQAVVDVLCARLNCARRLALVRVLGAPRAVEGLTVGAEIGAESFVCADLLSLEVGPAELSEAALVRDSVSIILWDLIN